MMENKKSLAAARAAVSLILSFILSLVLLLGTLLVAARTGLFSVKSFEKVMDEEYYRSVLEGFITSAEDYTIPTNIDYSVLEGAFTYEDVRRDVLGCVRSAFKGTEYKPDLAEAKGRLSENVDKYFADNEVEMDGEAADVRDGYVADICAIYEKSVKMPGIELILRAKDKFGLIFILGLAASFVIGFVLGFAVVKVHPKICDGLRWLAYAAGAAALMSFTAPAVVYFSGKYKLMQLSPEYFYRFVIGLIRRLIMICFTAAGVWLAVFAALAVLIAVLKRRGGTGEKTALTHRTKDQEDL